MLPTLRFIAEHELSAKHPFSAYWRFARWQVESRLRREVIFDWIDGGKLAVRHGMVGATGNIYCGLHEFADMSFLLHLLRPDDLFLDVGANVGSYTVLASSVCGARSIAFEPDPLTLVSLRRNIEVNGIFELVQVVESAVGASAGRVNFTTGHDATNKVVSSRVEGSREVQVTSLDEVLANEHPVLIKIDVEGYEPEVISGAIETLQKSSLVALIMETVDEHISANMRVAGFERATYQPFTRRLERYGAYQVGAGGQNTLFVRGDLVDRRVASAKRRNVIGVSF